LMAALRMEHGRQFPVLGHVGISVREKKVRNYM